MALWGLIVTVSLVFSFLFAFLGLAFVFPLLAHANWHLYRQGHAVIEPFRVNTNGVLADAIRKEDSAMKTLAQVDHPNSVLTKSRSPDSV